MLAPWADEIKDSNRQMRKHLGALLKEAREAKDLSVRRLATITGVNKSQICRIEAGRCNTTIDTINRLAGELGLKLTLIDE